MKFGNKKAKKERFRIINPPITNENIKQLTHKIECPVCRKVIQAKFQIIDDMAISCPTCRTMFLTKNVKQSSDFLNRLDYEMDLEIIKPFSDLWNKVMKRKGIFKY